MRYYLWLYGLGFLALILGTLIYVLVRPEGSSYLNQHPSFYQHLGLYLSSPSISIVSSLPSLFHVLAFSLFSISVLSRKYAFHSCLFWFVLNAAFEFIQHPKLLQSLDFPGILGAYARGTFDYLDILASFIGACLAFGIVWFLERGRDAEI